MIIYDGIKTEFQNSVIAGTITKEIERRIQMRMGRHTSQSELNSWSNSMMFMNAVLSNQDIPADAGISIEYNVPQTSKRVDFIISGYDQTQKANAVVIELKQWTSVEKVDGADALVRTYTGGANRTVVHPSYQAWSYASLISDYNETVQNQDIGIIPCTFLHNYHLQENDPLLAPQYQTYIEDAPVFTATDILKLQQFITKYIRIGDRKKILYEIDNGKLRPSKSLQNAIGNMIEGNHEFIMIDDQKVVYENILDIASRCRKDEKKRTVIVQGGPGTGKSVIAVNLLAQLTIQGQVVQYASKNSAPRDVYKQKLKGHAKKSRIDNMFKGTGVYYDAEPGEIQTIIVDEAHRMNAKSGMFHNLGENQMVLV